jgi:hypothetical protein
LKNLCQRTQQGPPFSSPAPAPEPTPPPTAGGPAPNTTTAGGTSATASAAAAAKPSPNAIGPDEIYCTTAQRFTADLHTPPVIELLTHTLRGTTRAGVSFSLSKVSTVSLTVSRAGKTVWTNSARVTHGKPKILWVTPSKAGTYTVTLRAVDLAGNSASTTGTIELSAPQHASPAKPHA